MKKAADPDVLDRCLLECASERGVGAEGRSLGAIMRLMQDRGFKVDDVTTRLEKLKKDDMIDTKHAPRGRSPLDDFSTIVVVKTDGKDKLQKLRATAQFNIRLPDEIRAELSALVGTVGDSEAAVAVTGLKEWIRMLKYPGIDFRWSPSGRKPYVTGTGLSVWELYRVWLDHAKDAEKVRRNFPDLRPAQISVATSYSTAYLHEMPEGAFGQRPPFVPEVKV